jgi:NAD(P)-dependent dehydrogenase (short-subunit alcohol dehydrogenase family)
MGARMKILVIGTGTIGTAVTAALTTRGHTVVPASRGGEFRVDLDRPDTVDALFEQVPGIEAVVSCAASGALTPIEAGTDEEFTRGLRGKLVGQILLLRHAIPRLPDGGSVTLTAGTFGEPVPGSSFGILVNTGLEAFAAAVAPELPRGIRVNAISPGWVSETLLELGMPPGGTPAAEVAKSYVDAVEDPGITGRTLRPS